MKGSIKCGLWAVNGLLIVSMIVYGGLAQGAALTVPTMFSNDAVLQRGIAVPVFGTAAAGAPVTVEFNRQAKYTNAASDGKWQVNLDPMQTLATPSTMVITSGAESITIDRIQVGEVWFGSGQSNMARDLTWDSDYLSAVASARNYNLRFFNISANGTPASTVWQVSNSTTAHRHDLDAGERQD